MSVLVVGLSHKSAPVSLLEKLSLDPEHRDRMAHQLLARDSISEAMIISTCNRVEVYVVTSSFHGGISDIVSVLQLNSGVDFDQLRSSLYVRYDDAAAEHMMVVTSGLDSMVLGEQQIIGQVRSAYQASIAAESVGPKLHGLVQASLHTGKRVHSETEIDAAGASMVSFAFEQSLGHLQAEDFRGKTALVLGAGVMASLAATHLGRLGINKLIISNRTQSRAERLAEHARESGVEAEVIDFGLRTQALRKVDIAVSATGAQNFTITAADIPAMDQRQSELLLIDLSLPRDIEDAVTERGARLVNIERLHAIRSDRGFIPSDAQAQAIVAEELKAYCSEQRIKDVVPAVTALRRHGAKLVESEMARLRSKASGLDAQELHEVERSMRRVVDKLLHQPTVAVKQLAAESRAVTYESALQELFGVAPAGRSITVDLDAMPLNEEIGA
ncbi:glutamyl-tRNA reductase [Corynebacterium sp. ES2794-CONJ1]|uniref:glutamyl-tRNA reductase n=1 Tax=unclassified Corynebacterium TaxID=2624378 RepID=UPI002168E09F|nr:MULTISPECIES: glutamyl-tRNA reductase [unclassified Corynebacterium]MCS4489721.1 glutamyl-tRNA reductase [Corynebacterium sp. ES2775-CONJ]MCS4531633.1 glutamyl-tRNA reductase [Corynebacterium sp. ES2730-CONJ]MCU9519029.1 glutamyl-tRNA reductase [Corynebacterium sp. ES2794-CONJ1]